MNSVTENTLRVLAVEDSEDDALLLKRQLEHGGFQVQLGRVDTEAALATALQTDRWDIVFSDFSMPKFNGIEALRVVREHDQDLPFIIVSGTIGEERAVQLMKTGAQDYCIKGNVKRLLPAVERELKEAQIRREHRLAQDHIERLAYFNTLTQLPNRHRLLDDLQHTLSQARPVQLLTIALANFQEINEILGYANGEGLVREVGGRLQQLLTDQEGIYHTQADMFAVVLTTEDRSLAERNAQDILKVLAPSYRSAGFRIHVSVRVGIVTSVGYTTDAATLLRSGDMAAAAARREERPFAWYDPAQEAGRPEKLALLADLSDALGTEQLSLAYQPKIDCRTGIVTGSEALLRWHHPLQGPIAPDQFIGLAERYGLIDEITRHVLRRVVEQKKSWRVNGPMLPVAINLSAKNLLDARLMAEVLEAAAEQDEKSGIEIEITETALMHDPERALAALKELHDAGIRICIDDFGTGFSSLGYLSKLPIHAIKVDKSFVLDLAKKADSDTIVRSTIGLAHNLRLKVIAEGVENVDTWRRLKDYDCDEGQGFYFAKPLPAKSFEKWIAQRKPK